MSDPRNIGMHGAPKMASCVLFYAENFEHVSPLLQCRWFFSRMWRPITCGKSTPLLAMPECEWYITNIVDSNNQSANIRDPKRKRKFKQFIVHPTTTILFTYSSYRIAICLEISRSIYSVQSDGGIAADEMISSLLLMLTQIHRSLQSQQHISIIYLTVIAHHSEINVSFNLWQGQMTLESDLSELLDALGPSSKVIEDLTFRRQPSEQWQDGGGMSMTSVAESLLFHVGLLPPHACPIAVLITPGVMDVAVSSVSKMLARYNIALHVLVVALPPESRPLGCVPEIDSLQVLAEATGGSLEVLSSTGTVNLESLGQIFIRPFYAAREETALQCEASAERKVGLRLFESRLQGYQLEGATLEHILAARVVEGFRIINISVESAMQEKGLMGNVYGTQKKPSRVFVNVRMEKRFTKVSTLIYFVSYATDFRGNVEEWASTGVTGQLGSLVDNYVYTKGTLSVEVVCLCPHRVVMPGNSLCGPSSSAELVADSRIILESDKRVSHLLGLYGMPGHIQSSSTPGEPGGKKRSDLTYRHTVVLQLLAASADLVENLCNLHVVAERHLYLRACYATTSMSGDLRCRNRIYSAIRQVLPTAKLSQLGALKWLCVVHASPTNSSALKHRLQQEKKRHIDIFEVVVVEVRQSVAVFVDLKISVMGNGEGVAEVVNIAKIEKSIQSAIESLEFNPMQTKRNFSNIAVSSLSVSRPKAINSIYLESYPSFFEVDLRERVLVESLVSEICHNKLALGFQIATFVKDSIVELCLCGVVPYSPCGIDTESLLQCKVECSHEGLLITYFWEPCRTLRDSVTQYKPSDAMNVTPELYVHIEDGILSRNPSEVIEESLTPSNCDTKIHDLVESLAQQDRQTCDFYSALTYIYVKDDKTRQGCDESLLLAKPSIFSQSALSMFTIGSSDWSCLKSYSYTRRLTLPSFADDLYSKSIQLDGHPMETMSLSRELREMLCNSLLKNLGLQKFEVVPNDCDVRDGEIEGGFSFTCCLSVPEGIVMLEVSPIESSENGSSAGALTPERSRAHSKSRSNSFVGKMEGILSPPSDDYDEDYMLAMSPDSFYRPEMEKESSTDVAASFDYSVSIDMLHDSLDEGVEGLAGDHLSCGDLTSGRLRIDFHFVSVPMNTLFSNDVLAKQSKCCLVPTDISSGNDARKKTPTCAETGKKLLRELQQEIMLYHRCNFALVMYTGLRNRTISHLSHTDLDMALKYCSSEYLELDITNLCRIKRTAMESVPASQLSNAHLFESTVGNYLSSIPDGNCFMFSSSTNSYSIPMHNAIYTIAIFVRISIVRKSSSDTANDPSTEEFAVPCSPEGLSQVTLDICNLQEENLEYADENFFLRVECLSASADDVGNEGTSKAFPGDDDGASLSSHSSKDRSHPGLTGHIGIPLPSVSVIRHFYRNSLIRRLTSEFEALITFDTLYTLLLMPVVTTKTIVLVQHCLRGTRNLCQITHSMDFLTPTSAGASAFVDMVTTLFEEELQTRDEFNKIGDIFYARGWTLIVEAPTALSTENQEEVAQVGTPHAHNIPCWILLSISQCSSVSAEGLLEGMGITTMDISITLRAVGDYTNEQQLILKELTTVLDKCCYRVNQKVLLKEMNQSRVASAYLIRSIAEATPVVNSAPIRPGRSSHSRNKEETVIPTFVLPEKEPTMPASSNWKSYTPGCFECHEYGRIELLLPNDFANVLTNSLTHNQTVTTLENLALHPFVISNIKKCYVYVHRSGDIYYMAFAPARDEKDRTISLVAFGVSELSSAIKLDIQKTLEVKLTEIIANVISLTILPRRAVLPTTHVQFLKDCGLSKRIDITYNFPSYVTDPQFYCVIAKQMFHKSEVFVPLTLQYNEKREPLSSKLHPSTFGYDMAVDDVEQQREKMAHSRIMRPHLERKTHVVAEHSDPCVISPVFFDRKSQKQIPRKDRKYDASVSAWEQGEFTLLYNPHAVGEKEKNISKRRDRGRSFTGSSGGLALIEIQPIRDDKSNNCDIKDERMMLSTGSVKSLISDVTSLIHHMKCGCGITLDSNKTQEAAECKHTENTCTQHIDTNSLYKSEYTKLIVRIYPTRGINQNTLAESFQSCFNQALVMYCMERLYTAYQSREFAPVHIPLRRRTSSASERDLSFAYSENKTPDSCQSSVFHSESEVTPTVKCADLLQACHDIILRTSTLDPLACSNLLQVPISLPKAAAHALHRKVMSFIHKEFPTLTRSMRLPRCNQMYSMNVSTDADSKAVYSLPSFPVEWLDARVNATDDECSCLLGDNFTILDVESYEWKDNHVVILPDSSATSTGIRWISDYSPESSMTFPLWLRRRRYSIEITISTSGVYAFFFNVDKKVADKIKDCIREHTKDALRQLQNVRLLHLEKTGLRRILNPIHTMPQKEDGGVSMEKVYRLQTQISGLFWPQRVLSRLIHSTDMTPSHNTTTDNLLPPCETCDIPTCLWSEGIVLRMRCIELPSFRDSKITLDTDRTMHTVSPDMQRLTPTPEIAVNESLSDFITFLRHLLGGLDCIFVGGIQSDSIYVLLPVIHTSCLCMVELSRSIPGKLLVIHRVADCRDIIASVRDHYGMESEEWLISPASAACLREPCIGTSEDSFVEDDFGQCSSVMDAVTNHATVMKLESSVYYAALGALYFFNQSIPEEDKRNIGRRALETMRMISEVAVADVLLVEKAINISEILNPDTIHASLPSPSVSDIINALSRSSHGEAFSVPLDSSTGEMCVCFRFISSPRGPISPSKRSEAISPALLTRTGDYSDTSTRMHRTTHRTYAESILGISFLQSCPDDRDYFYLTSLIFPGEKVMGSERDLLLNIELEERMSEELECIQYIPLSTEDRVFSAICDCIVSSGRSAVRTLCNESAWDMLYNRSIGVTNMLQSSLISAVLKHSPATNLRCLDFLLEPLAALVSGGGKVLRSALHRAFGSRFVYWPAVAEETSIAHYVIIGKEDSPNDDMREKHLIHIEVKETGPAITFVELACSSEGDSDKQRSLIETFVDIILFSATLICDDDVLLLKHGSHRK